MNDIATLHRDSENSGIYDAAKLRILAFEKRQGGAHLGVRAGGWILYPNGAARETNPMGALVDPPQDKRECAQNIILYHDTRRRRAVEAFTERKQFYADHARVVMQERYAPALPAAKEAAVKELTELLEKVRECEAAVKKAREALGGLGKPAHIAAMEASSARNKQEASDMLSAIGHIKI